MYQSTEPARYWQQQLVEWGPKVLFAILILIVTHFVAKAVQWGIAKLIDRVPVLKRHPGVGGESVGTELGRLAYWLVWLVGLIAALQPLGLSGVLTPVTALTNEVFAFLPLVRRCELAADRFAARLLGDPDALARALQRIEAVNASEEPRSLLGRLLRTHPVLERRLAALRAMPRNAA